MHVTLVGVVTAGIYWRGVTLGDVWAWCHPGRRVGVVSPWGTCGRGVPGGRAPYVPRHPARGGGTAPGVYVPGSGRYSAPHQALTL